jgi:hypothetical protein
MSYRILIKNHIILFNCNLCFLIKKEGEFTEFTVFIVFTVFTVSGLSKMKKVMRAMTDFTGFVKESDI